MYRYINNTYICKYTYIIYICVVYMYECEYVLQAYTYIYTSLRVTVEL